MQLYHSACDRLSPTTRAFYRRTLTILRESGIPSLVCGSFALEAYTGIARYIKDLDIVVRPADCTRALAVLGEAGYATELSFPHWLGKVSCGEDFIDIIFAAGNGMDVVDDTWFAHAVDGRVLGMAVKFSPPEEIIWHKCFVMERERFDGADVAHLLRAHGRNLDWDRVLWRFGPHWQVLFAHLILFGFIYPAHRCEVPPAVMHELMHRLQAEVVGKSQRNQLCQGTLLSRAQYLADIEHWGYEDARLPPRGNMTKEEIHQWTAAIELDEIGMTTVNAESGAFCGHRPTHCTTA